ncbi:MAG: hypothetical protein WC352_05700 [Candidatus Omnitrophota bacterium]|jgi:hypothetical protein
MKNVQGLILILFCVCLFPCQPAARGQVQEKDVEPADIVESKPDATDPVYLLVTTRDRQHFRIPKDMQLKKKGNVYFFEPMESYVFKRTVEMKDDVDAIKKRLALIEERLGIMPEQEDTDAKAV